MGANLNYNIIHRFNRLQRLGIAAGYDLFNVFQSVHLIAGVDSLGRIAHLEIYTAFQARLPLQDRNAYILGTSGIYSRLKYNVRSLRKIATYDFGSADNRRKIRRVVNIYRRRHRDDMKLGLLQILFIRGKENLRLLDSLIANLFRRIHTRFIKLDFCLVEIKADNVHAFVCKSNRNRHTNVAKTYKGEFFFFIDYFFKQ